MASVDFPLPVSNYGHSTRRRSSRNPPVRPSNPTRSPAFSLKDTSWSTAGSSGAYLTSRFSTTTRESLLEFDGQYAGTRLFSITAGGSCGRLKLADKSTSFQYVNDRLTIQQPVRPSYEHIRDKNTNKRRSTYLRSNSRAKKIL